MSPILTQYPQNKRKDHPLKLTKITKPPWYYRPLIKLAKPIYRLLLWKRLKHDDAYTKEVNQRFGHFYPKRPTHRTTPQLLKLGILPLVSNLGNDFAGESNTNVINDFNATTHADSNKIKNTRDLQDKRSEKKLILIDDLSNSADVSSIIESNQISSSSIIQPQAFGPLIWCHAVSLGETNTINPLIRQFLAAGFAIWMTNTTHTGYARTQTLFKNAIASGQLNHSYVPVDDVQVIKRFLQHTQPMLALFVETELWANTLALLATYAIPSVLVNARLSQTSFKRYQKAKQLSQSMMANLSLIIAQDKASALRFRQLGALSQNIRRADSLKWMLPNDQKIQQSLIEAEKQKTHKTYVQTLPDAAYQYVLNSHRAVWIAASTHEKEEALALTVHKKLINQQFSEPPLLIIVPRHPERFAEVAQLIAQSQLMLARRSQNDLPNQSTQVYLADTLGELNSWYAVADAAMVGGSFVNVGGHNPIESLAVATPVIMGPFTKSCQHIVDELQKTHALIQLSPQQSEGQKTVGKAVKSQPHKPEKFASDVFATELFNQLLYWLQRPDLAKLDGQRGQQQVLTHQQAAKQQYDIIIQLLAEVTGC